MQHQKRNVYDVQTKPKAILFVYLLDTLGHTTQKCEKVCVCRYTTSSFIFYLKNDACVKG